MNMLAAGTLLSAGLPANAMQQQRFNPDTRTFATAQAAPSNVNCSVNPASITASQPTTVSISLTANSATSTNTARMAASAPATLFLGRAAGARYVALGAFTARPQQQGVVYNITVTINEPEPSVIQFGVSSNPDSGRYTAVPCRLAVGPASQSNNGSGNNGGNNSHGNQNSGGWGGFLGQVIGGIINNKDHTPTPTPTPEVVATPTPWSTPQVNLRSASANGLAFHYPDNWNYHQEVVNLGGPINLRNFDNYQYGGVVPNGGATIDITSTPLTSTGLAALAQAELGALSAQNLRVDDHPAVLMDYTDAFAPGLNYENQAVYVQAGSKVYKFFLSYRSGDPNGGNFVQDFQKVISSTRFTAN